ncbi:galectin-4-like isoform X2 [Hyla sarda]|uniref:galectin-4-like isoform X2 n=1 Tax=Hyla sarda TaxID=327740 RepID=UPI0024C376F0|nr:galectin-4-like isoform X2 [Hyla sarda]XP_056395858.1 galectin-4-like isoform X2 [Hyla sarda]XP_056395859.1 galectin-4-like isoform X2 [Hyla sarda]
MTNQVSNRKKTVPFKQPIYGGLRIGMSVHIQGVVPHHVNRFHVNFSCGQHHGADIAFHFNPRWDGKDKVVFNSLQSGSWGHEEKKKDKFPFHKGGHFDLAFFANLGGFQVNVNGSHFYDFNHRIPLERVDCVQVEGDVNIRCLSIVGGGGGGGPMVTPSFPSAGGPMVTPSFPSAGVMPLPVYPAMTLPAMGGPVYNPPIPYHASIPGGVTPKKTFVIRGFLPMGSQQFHINFKTVTGEIAFHFNVRLYEFTVVRNSFLGGSWGPEERQMVDNPFMAGQSFDISIRCGNGRYKVFVNGQPFCEYFHRFQALHMIDSLEIGGNVSLSLVQF